MYSVLVTAGPTHEYIDRVRYIANNSSGKQGYAIAESFYNLGCDVHLVSGPVHLPRPHGCKMTNIVSCQEMLHACNSLLPVNIVICSAAVCDFRPKKFINAKLSKLDISTIELEMTPDIVKSIGYHPESRPDIVVGFSLECKRDVESSLKKLREKGCDIIISNCLELENGETVMGGDYNKVLVLSKRIDPVELPIMQKSEIADYIAKYVIEYIKII